MSTQSIRGSINKLLRELNVSNTSCIFLDIINKNSYIIKLFLGCVKMENVEVMKYGSTCFCVFL